MTLSEALINYRSRYHLSTKYLAYRVGLSVPTILKIEKADCYSQLVAKKIADALGADFEQFVRYSICVVCGDLFYAKVEKQGTCSQGCSYYWSKHKNGKQIHQQLINQNKQQSNEYLKKRKTAKKASSIAEFNQEARNHGKSYGEWTSVKLLNAKRS